MAHLGRRDFIAAAGAAVGAAGWPRAVPAQPSKPRVIGVLGSEPPVGMKQFLERLNQGGFVEGRNLAIEYRWDGGQYDRLP
jgi:putative tryptophan/tyrosine transport system substrate-binding protein